MTLFNFDRANRLGLGLVRIVADEDHSRTIGRWLSGRIFGRYISVFIPLRW